MLLRVTGRGYMDVNRISGYIPGKMVFYLMQASSALAHCVLSVVLVQMRVPNLCSALSHLELPAFGICNPFRTRQLGAARGSSSIRPAA